ncbi:MAG: serine/threonine protein kinase [Planctomycetes bacterium]|nr:serine/threonine protein kinase [Planctomycetota bacterium]
MAAKPDRPQSERATGVRGARPWQSDPLPPPLGPWQPVLLAGEGRLGRVYRARPAEAGSQAPADYAVKVLHERLEDDPLAVELLRREAAVAGQVSDPHLVSVLAAGLDGPPYYLVMPWLVGRSLDVKIGRLSLAAALWTARQVAEALDALHQRGWMHADVKPANIMVSPEGHATLIDLGFARRRDEAGSVVDRPLLGTIAYIAPEMVTSTLGADIRSDIYSLGATLYELLTGRPPFTGNDLAELISQHRQSVPRDVREMNSNIPDEVADLIANMLAKEPLRRPQTPRELIDRLVRLEIATFAQR